jgi:hypothetical protein
MVRGSWRTCRPVPGPRWLSPHSGSVTYLRNRSPGGWRRVGDGLPLDQCEEGGFDIGRAGSSKELVERVVGEQLARPHQQQSVAPAGLIHHMAGHQKGHSNGRQSMEDRPQVAAEHGVEADRRFVEHQKLGYTE